MKNQLPGGIPLESNYRAVLKSEDFRDMEEFSNRFHAANADILAGYAKRWINDPLHQWSRQWEYPFVFSRLVMEPGRDRGATILDAGSGVTFFPHYIREKCAWAQIHCCDSDAVLEEIYKKINKGAAHPVEFYRGDIRGIPCEDETYDAVYCISVLEHTDRFKDIIAEFYRIIKPGGRLIVTFDVSFDGTRDISPARGTELLSALSEKFNRNERFDRELSEQLAAPGIFTTRSAREIDADLLPWKYPAFLYRLKSLLSGKGFGPWPPELTVFCMDLTKARN
jgi:SAM-dependent methyltransferase